MSRRLAMRPPPATAQPLPFPSPIDGINAADAVQALGPTDCVYAWNVVAGELGVRTRPGYAEWVTGLTGGTGNQVPTLVPYQGSSGSGTKDKLFAVTPSGIWDASSSTGVPTELLAFPSSAGMAGYGIHRAFVTTAGHFIALCDEENGYHLYTESTDSWAQVAEGAAAGEISGVDPRDLVFVALWKKRLWFVERDSTRAWYLEVNAITGEAQKFDFGPVFPHGGTLVGLWNWTRDGGEGSEDLLVAISSSGDVAVYGGTNPADADAFYLVGTYFVPGVPAGRRIATDVGGELLVLSMLGALPLSRLLGGASGEDATIYASRKIGPIFTELARKYGSNLGWSVMVDPSINALVITIPTAPGQATQQLVMAFSNRSWWRWRGVPVLSGGVYARELYFGTQDGRVCRLRGAVDDVQRDDSSSWSAVAWSLLTAFHALGGRHKKVAKIRATLLAGNASPSIKATAKWDYDRKEPTAPTGNGGGGAGAWGTGTWGNAVWGSSSKPSKKTVGATGEGRELAIALQGNAISKTTITAVDVDFEQGGIL